MSILFPDFIQTVSALILETFRAYNFTTSMLWFYCSSTTVY